MSKDDTKPRTLGAAIRQLEGAQRALTKVMGELADAREELANANERVARLEKALRIYANEDNWNDDGEVFTSNSDYGWEPAAAALRRKDGK